MTAKVYGEALYKAIQGGMTTPKAIARLKEVLGEHGRTALYRPALEDAMLRFKADEKQGVVSVRVAEKGAEKKFGKIIKQFIEEAGAHTSEVIVDERLVGGFVARSTTHELDQSYKKSLLAIYRSLIA